MDCLFQVNVICIFCIEKIDFLYIIDVFCVEQVGFDEFGGMDDFSMEDFEDRLVKFGVIYGVEG